MVIKILAVDDEIQVINSLNTIFTTMLNGFLFLSATTANSGLNMIKSQEPDVIIVDVRLGPASGMDLIADYYKWIETKKQAYHPSFIVITAYDDETVRKRAKEYHIDTFLVKPFSKEAITYAICRGISKVLDGAQKQVNMVCDCYKKVVDELKDAEKRFKSE